jgi:hypothetical protein
MITKTFETEEQAIAYLTEDKDTSCTLDLTDRFLAARKEGLSLHQSAEKAQLLHSHDLHGHGKDVPPDFPYDTDEKAEAHITDGLLQANDDGRAQERVDLTLSIYRRYRSWGVNIFYAGSCATATAEYEWYTTPGNDMKEDDVYQQLSEITDEDLRKFATEVFEESRKEGLTVWQASRETNHFLESAQKAKALIDFLAMATAPRGLVN